MLRNSKRNSIPPYTHCFSLSCLKSNIRLIIFSNLTTEPLVHTETYTNETKLPSAAPFYQSCVPEVLPVIPESGIAGLGAMKTEG